MGNFQWSDVTGKALKALGSKGKLPRAPREPGSAISPIGKALASFNDSRTELEEKLLAVEDACEIAKNAFKQYADLVDGDTFGLDPKKKDDKKRIDEATEILLAELKEGQDICSVYAQKMADLNRILTNLERLSKK